MQGDGPQTGRSNYLDFELEIGEGCGREYPVAVLRSPAGEPRARMHFPFDELALDNCLSKLQIALLRSGGKRRSVPSDEERAVQNFGQALFDALLSDDVRSCYDVSLREAEQQEKGLRLKLRIRSPEMAALPWEFMYDRRRAEYVCLLRQTPIVRYLELPRPTRLLAVTPPLRILGMVASPADLPALDIEREKQRVERATQDLHRRGLVELEWLPGQSWRDLHEAMWGGPWHVFHFIGHGGFDANTDEGFIALADDQGQKHHLNANRLGLLLTNQSALRLVLLNSCEGARGGVRDIFSSTASILVRRGIPAVLAMQYEITDRAAIEFAHVFYSALARGSSVDEAVVLARQAIRVQVTNTVEWGTPVLYMHAPDGVLFQVTGMPPEKQPPHKEPEPPVTINTELERRLEQFYIDGQVAFRVADWDRAYYSFQSVVNERPDYRDAGTKLQEVERQRELARLYAQAQAAQVAGDWPGARSALEKLVAEAPGFKDAAALLATAKKKGQLADLYAQARQLHRAGRWQAVANVFTQMAALEPDYPDREGLLPSARREIAAQKRQAEVQDLYRRAVLEVDAGRWAEAQPLLARVKEMESGYGETERLLVRVEAEIERGKAERQRQEQVARLYEEAQGLARARQWRQALAKMGQIRTLDPQFPDPTGIAAKAQAEVGREAEEARRPPLPAWLWPAAGAAGVLLVVLVIALGAALRGGDGTETAVPSPSRTAAAAVTAAPALPPPDTSTLIDTSRLPTATDTPQPTATLAPTATSTPKAPQASEPTTRAKDGMVVVYVPAGDFAMGSNEYDNEKPVHTVTLDAFWIDRTEVSNAQFRKCVEAGACQAPTTCNWGYPTYNNGGKTNHPAVCVSWDQAEAYCQWAGGRLPTEAEWEKAARGRDGRVYPWGNDAPDCNRAQYGDCGGQTVPVGSKPAGASPYGVLNMAGNAWEWVADWYDGVYYTNAPTNNPKGPDSGNYKVLRGGSWFYLWTDVRAALRYYNLPTDRSVSVGFRCAGSPGG